MGVKARNGNHGEWQAVPTEVRGLLRSITRELKRSYHPKKVMLFGSFARNEQGPSSDLDLLIIKNTKQPPRIRWMTVRKILRRFTRQFPISPMVYTEKELAQRLAAGDFFIREILSEAKVLHG
jgi:predicted nucleotidyltransferase